MDNILFDIWIDLGKGRKAILKELQSIGWNTKILELTVKTEDSQYSKKLIAQGRQVADGSGNLIDFEGAYPYVTEEGKVTITKKFMFAFI